MRFSESQQMEGPISGASAIIISNDASVVDKTTLEGTAQDANASKVVEDHKSCIDSEEQKHVAASTIGNKSVSNDLLQMIGMLLEAS